MLDIQPTRCHSECGHGVIALVTALLALGAQPAKGADTPITLDTPAGLVRATAHLDQRGQVTSVSFLNVPSFVYASGIELVAPAYGHLTVDIAFGGAFYAYLPAERVGLRVVPQQREQVVAAGEAIKRAVNARLAITHHIEEDLGFLYGTIFTDRPEDAAHHSRNVCIFADGEVDCSPTGTGVSGRLALLATAGELSADQHITIESILGAASTFSGSVVAHTQVEPFEAVVPEVRGTAFHYRPP